MIEFKSGKKYTVMAVETAPEAADIIEKLVEIRNNDDFWKQPSKAHDEFVRFSGTEFDIYDSMSVYVDGKLYRQLWGRGF